MGAAYEPKYHPDLVTFPRSLSQFFGDRAKALLELEIENPSLATIQALVVYSNYEASGTRDTRSWLYSGKSDFYTFGYWKQTYPQKGWPCDLPLTRDFIWTGLLMWKRALLRSRNAESDKKFSGVQVSTISMISMLAFVSLNTSLILNRFWGYYLGRSVRSPGAGVSVRKPCWNDTPGTSHQATRWRAYGCQQVNGQSLVNPSDMIFSYWISLYELMSPVTDVL